jgi:adenosylcobinamide-phosphate synthase
MIGAMSFFAILIALVLEQARPLALPQPGARRPAWLGALVRRNLDAGQAVHGWVAWLLAVALPAAVAGLVYWALWQFSLVLAFVWLVLVLYVTVGFRQFSHHFSDIRQALDVGDETLAAERWPNGCASTPPPCPAPSCCAR